MQNVIENTPTHTAHHLPVEEMDPAAEYAYWRDHFLDQPYVQEGANFEDYVPAYVFGIHSFAKFADRDFDELESELAREWSVVRGTCPLEWEHARHASRDSWEHSRRALLGNE